MSREIQRWIKTLEAKRKKVGEVRDEIREVVSEMNELKDKCDSAYHDIQSAIDSLSELA